MKKNIAIIGGGDSSESIVSLKSAAQIKQWLDKERYNVYTVLIDQAKWVLQDEEHPNVLVDKNDFSILLNNEKVVFDCALIAIHGTPGEDGKLQSYFDLVKIPYTTPNAFISALTFNKYACKAYMKEAGIKMAEAVLVRKNDAFDLEAIIEKVGLPCFVKPNGGGSSFGISKVKQKEEVIEAVNKAMEEDSEVIIEAFIEGTEVTNGVVKTAEKEIVLPITEIVSHNDFFDYDAKYTGKSDEITPARLSDELTQKVQQLSSRIYDILDCKGIVRVDYIIEDEEPYFLEINTVPGMSGASIIPQQAQAMGLQMPDLFTLVIEDCIIGN